MAEIPSGHTSLLRRSKRNVATYFKGECTRYSNLQKFHDFLDNILGPHRPIDDFETLDWCRWLISGGSTFDEFSKTVRQYDNAVTCGLVWTADFVAYRCRTCGISPCMSLCSDCFQAGNHEGHDYNMFRSQAGGACDCGDVGVMNCDGFCPRHGPGRQRQSISAPADLMANAEIMMPHIVLRLLHHLRDNCKPEMRSSYVVTMQDAEQFLLFLQNLSDMGAAMRRVMNNTLTNPDVYNKLTKGKSGGSSTYYTESQVNYEAAVASMPYPESFEKHQGKLGLNQKLEHKTLLEELVFWTVKYEFPQKVVTLLLSLLPDDGYKDSFTRAFIQHYSRISLVLVQALDRAAVANRVVHISVQLFSNESLAVTMAKDCNLLYTLVLSLTSMIENIRVGSTLEDTDPLNNFHSVVDCSHEIMKAHCYWPIISDLINLLSHKEIALRFLADEELVTMWMDLLSYLQGMNLNQREMSQHVEFEPDTYYAAFSAELEISASPMWSVLNHCKEQTSSHTLRMIAAAQVALQDWFAAINCQEAIKPNPHQLTFHLPLHRYLSTFMMQAVQHQGIKLTDILPEESLMKKILIHVLQIQVCLAQVYAGMWVRNGIQIKGQAMTYVQCHFCYSMADADIFLIQVCAAQLDPDYFVKTVLERFSILNWLSFSTKPSSIGMNLSAEHELSMLEGAMSLFSTLLGIRTYLGIEEKDLIHKEMVSLLCMSDRQHSQLMDLMPEKSGISGQGKELFEPTLRQVADYKAPVFEVGGGLQQGTYVPKDIVWDTGYDPVHVSQRAIYRRDFQASLDRYTEYVKQKRKYNKKTPPWPPFKNLEHVHPAYKGIFRILNCRTMHSFFFCILYKAVQKDSNIPESVLYHCIHLLNMSLLHSPSKTTRQAHCGRGSVSDGQYHRWFTTLDIKHNASEVLHEVIVTSSVVDQGQVDSCTRNVDMDTSTLEEMFQLAPSVGSTMTGPITAAQIPGLTMMTLPCPSAGGASFAIATPAPHPPSSAHQVKPKYESRGVTTEQMYTTPVPLNESIVSLLVKLHSKLSGKPNSYVPISVAAREMETSMIGDGPHFIGRFLDGLSHKSVECAKTLAETYKIQQLKEETGKRNQSKNIDKEGRRKKAFERQQKLMAEFASKQKAFMEQAMEAEDDYNTSKNKEDAANIPDEVEAKCHDCVICSQSTPSTPQRPVALVVFLQASSVLGHRKKVDQPRYLSPELRQQFTTCATFQKKRLETLLKHFEEGSCQMSVNIGWEGGVTVETCGHYLHLDCHSSYLKSLETQNPTENLAVSKGEYWCPLCRKLSNSVIPIVPEEGRFSLVKPLSHNPHQKVIDLADMMVKRPSTPGPEFAKLTTAMGSVMEDLTNATYSAFKMCIRSHTSESVLLFICSIARANLEVELLQRGGTLHTPPPSSFTKKNCFLPLLHVLSLHSKVLTMIPTAYTELWAHVTGVSLSEESSSVSLYQNDVPLLLKDVTALLIQITLTLPVTMEPGHFDFLVQMLYNVVYVQALCVMSCKFTTEEREAWRRKGQHDLSETMEGMLSHIITRLSLSRLFDDVDKDQSTPAICQSVWSPHSVEDMLQEFCLPFLRISSLMKHHLFGLELTYCQDRTEFQYLCSYLNLINASPELPSQREITSAACVNWAISEPLKLTRAWATDYLNLVGLNPADGKSLLLVKPMWYSPHLIVLPEDYYTIFQTYRSKQCTVCTKQPRDPSICLVCSDFLCFRDTCCRQNMMYECVQHSITCGGGTGMFLLVNSSVIVVIRGPRATLWGSIYLDEHGEEDRDLKRGKPLYLSKERYSLLEKQWLSHNFDHVCKKWIWHHNRL